MLTGQFSKEFASSIFRIFSRISQLFSFSSKHAQIERRLCKIFCKIGYHNAFFTFLKKTEHSSVSKGLCPRTPHYSDLLKCFPSQQKALLRRRNEQMNWTGPYSKWQIGMRKIIILSRLKEIGFSYKPK